MVFELSETWVAKGVGTAVNHCGVMRLETVAREAQLFVAKR